MLCQAFQSANPEPTANLTQEAIPVGVPWKALHQGAQVRPSSPLNLACNFHDLQTAIDPAKIEDNVFRAVDCEESFGAVQTSL